MKLDLFPFGGYPYPIQAHERRACDIGSEAGSYTNLSLMIYDHSLGWAQEHRKDLEDGPPKQRKIPPPPPSPQRGKSMAKFGAVPYTPNKRGGGAVKNATSHQSGN